MKALLTTIAISFLLGLGSCGADSSAAESNGSNAASQPSAGGGDIQSVMNNIASEVGKITDLGSLTSATAKITPMLAKVESFAGSLKTPSQEVVTSLKSSLSDITTKLGELGPMLKMPADKLVQQIKGVLKPIIGE